MRRPQFIRSQAGQAIVLVALMVVVLFAGVGIAIDAGLGYYYKDFYDGIGGEGAVRQSLY